MRACAHLPPRKDKKMKNLLATLTQYKAIKAQIESLEAQLKEKRIEITDYMSEKGTTKLTCGQYVATVTECTKRSLDEKMIRELYPEVAEATEKVTTYERFTVK